MTSKRTKTRKLVGWTSIGAMWASFLSFSGTPIEWLKNSLIFHPDQRVDVSPANYGFSYEDVWFGGSDGRLLHGWYLPGDGGAMFLWFHGNAGNIGNRLGHARLLTDELGVGHFLFDYQGYGNSKGEPSLPGFMADSRAAIAVVAEKGWASGKQLVYIGESLGCAAVVAVGIEQPPDRAILLAPFYSLRAMGERILFPLAFIVEDDLNTARIISHFQSPLMVIHGTQDRTIPFQQGKSLYTLANQPKVFHTVHDGGHTDLHVAGGDAYFRVIGEFLTEQ